MAYKVQAKSSKKSSSTRYSKIAKRRERRINFILILYFLLFLILAGGFIYIMRLPSLQITEINVSGNTIVSTAGIKKLVQSEISGDYFFVIPKTNIFLLSKDNISTKILEKFKELEEVNINKNGDRSIEIEVIERSAKALWCADSSECFILDGNGFIFDQAKIADYPEFIVLKGFISGNPLNNTYDKDLLNKFFTIQNSFKTNSNIKPTIFEFISDSEVFVYTNIGKIIVDPNTTDITSIVDNVILLNNNIMKESNNKTFEYIDTRFRNKMFYKI